MSAEAKQPTLEEALTEMHRAIRAAERATMAVAEICGRRTVNGFVEGSADILTRDAAGCVVAAAHRMPAALALWLESGALNNARMRELLGDLAAEQMGVADIDITKGKVNG